MIRAQVTPLPSGGRMLTHTDITDLIHMPATSGNWPTPMLSQGCPNQRDFLARARAEWDRFRRYHEPFCGLRAFIVEHDVGEPRAPARQRAIEIVKPAVAVSDAILPRA